MKESLPLGSWEQFFRPILGVSLCHPLVDRSALWRSGFHILSSLLLAWTLCVPLTDVGVGLGPSPFGPVASRPPLGIGLLRRPRGNSFHLGVFSCVGLPRMGGLLVALPEVRLPGLGC